MVRLARANPKLPRIVNVTVMAVDAPVTVLDNIQITDTCLLTERSTSDSGTLESGVTLLGYTVTVIDSKHD